MTKLILLFSLSSIFYFANGQAPFVQWQKCFGGSGNESAKSIKQTNDGGYIVVGSTTSNDGDVTGNHGGYDAWIIKLDANGNTQWSKVLGGSADDYFNWVEQTKDSGYIVAGYTNSNNGTISGNHGSKDALIIKFTKNGNIIWQKIIGGSGNDWLNCIKEVQSGGYTAIGQTESFDGNLTGIYQSSYGPAYLWQLKLDSLGNIQSQVTDAPYAGNIRQEGSKIIQTSDKGFAYIVDTYRKGGTSSYKPGIRIAKVDTLNQLKWSVVIEDYSYQYPFKLSGTADLLETTDKNIIVSGLGNNFGLTGNNGVLYNVFDVCKIDTAGNTIWKKAFFTDSSRELLTSSTFAANGNIILAGYTKGLNCLNCDSSNIVSTNNHDTTGKTYDVWLVGVSNTGEFLWQKCYGGKNFDEIYDFHLVKDSGYIAVGETNSNDGDISGNHGGSDIWVVKFTPIILPIKIVSFKAQKENISVFLNWQTVDEINVSHFNIQRSINGREFTIIGKTNAKGANTYFFKDKDFVNATPIYYRLEIVDKDGSKTYSNVQTINNKLFITNNSIFPNPAKEQITIKGNYKELKITDNLGKIVITKLLDVGQTQTTVNISQLTKGIYFVQCTTNDKTITEKLIIE